VEREGRKKEKKNGILERKNKNNLLVRYFRKKE
jgi:hypothetical protein